MEGVATDDQAEGVAVVGQRVEIVEETGAFLG